MAEPASTSTISITALAVALLGPMAGPYALIVFAALAGSLWPISAVEATSRVASAFLLFRCTAMAVVFTGAAANWIQSHYAIQSHEAMAPVAFFIGAFGNGKTGSGPNGESAEMKSSFKSEIVDKFCSLQCVEHPFRCVINPYERGHLFVFSVGIRRCFFCPGNRWY